MEKDSLFSGLPAPSSTLASYCVEAGDFPSEEPYPQASSSGPSILKMSSVKRSSSTPEDGESKRVRFKTLVVAKEEEILGAMQKIGVHIKNPAKFSKACKLAVQLLDSGGLTKNTAECFFYVLKAAMSNPNQATEYDLRADYLALFNAVQEKLDCFSQVHKRQIEVWLLWAKMANDLYTDDTFVFSKSAGCLRQAVDALSEPVAEENRMCNVSMATSGRTQCESPTSICSLVSNLSNGDAVESDPFGLSAFFPGRSKKDERAKKKREGEAAKKQDQEDIDMLQREQREALLKCLKIAADRYKHPWAQTIIDITIKHAFDNITKFTPPQREAIEKLWTSVRGQQLKRKQGKSLSGKIDSTAFERLQDMYATEKISIRRPVGSQGDRSAEQWLG